MKTNIIHKILYFLLIAVIVVILLFGINQCSEREKAESVVRDYKVKMLEMDSLRKVSDGHYQKLVNDLYTEKELIKVLKGENKELADLIAEQKKKLIAYSKIKLTAKQKKDSVKVASKTENGKEVLEFADYYPDKENPFVVYEGVLRDKVLYGGFTFKTFGLDMVITEKSKGLFEVDFKAPEWLELTSLEVHSLPLSPIRVDNFDWYLGTNLGLHFVTYRPVLDLEWGFRYKKSLFGIIGNTNRELKIGYKHLF